MDTRFSVAGVAGWGTTVALIIGLFNALSPKTASEMLAAPAADPMRSQQSKRSISTAPRDTHVVVTGRQLLNRFYGDTVARKIRGAVQQYQLGVLYVTVPDPIDSHLDWAYDAQLNATRRALERDGYVIDRVWMPWRSSRDAASASSQLEATANGETARSDHPGVMLFRQSKPDRMQLRLIYVIGEVPTAGIHKRALIRALTEGDSLFRSGGRFVRDTSAGCEVRIVGPAFSGSAPSLRRVIDRWRSSNGREKRPIRIITGSASNTENAEFLRDSTITFGSTVYDDGSLALFETKLLGDRMGIRPEQTAILRETSTQYGQLTIDSLGDLKRIQIPFPMHISELREEYARNPDQLIIGHDMPGDQRNVRLPLKLGEGARLADGPPVVSDLTPPAVDAMLDDIARSLNAHHVKAVGILATDARDVIFLGTEVRKRVHDVVLFTYGSNILYARPDVSQWLRGMLVVSTYPVTVESQFWDVTQTGRQRISFSGDMAEGMYNAVLMQLGDSASRFVTDYSRPLAGTRDTPGAEKRPAQPAETRPEIWIATVGTSSMLPVTILEPSISDTASYVMARTLRDTAVTTNDSLRKAAQDAQEGPVSKSNIGVLILLVGIGFAWLLRDQLDWREEPRARDGTRLMRPADVRRHLAAMQEAVSAEQWKGDWCKINRIAQTSSLLFQHEMYTILRVVSLTLALIATLMILVRVRGHGVGDPWSAELGVSASLLVGAFVVSQSLWFIARIGIVSRGPVVSYYDPRTWPDVGSWMMWIVEALGRSTTFLVGGASLVVILALAHDVTTLSPVDARIFFFRSTAVTGGVSPGIPLFIGGALFYGWCIWNAKRVALLLKSTAFEQLFFDGTGRSDASRGDACDISLKSDPAPRHESAAARPQYNTPVTIAPVRRHYATATTGATQYGGGTAVADAPVATRPRELSKIDLTPHSSIGVAAEPDVRQSSHPNERRKDTGDLAREEIGAHVRQVRLRLSLSVPGFEGVVVFLTMAFLVVWGWRQFNLTIDALALPHSTLFGARQLTNFDLLLRLCALGAIGATLFGTYRLVGTWVALREALRDLGEMSLLYAFDALPLPVARLTRLGFGHQPSDPVIAGALRRGWDALDRVNASLSLVTALQPSDAVREPEPTVSTRPADSRPMLSRCATLLDQSLKDRLATLFAALQTAWKTWPAALDAVAADVWDVKESADNAKLRKSTPLVAGAVNADDTPSIQRTREKWLLVAGQCAAVYTVEYIEWVIHHLRNLAAFLLTAIILVNVLLSSYPFQPQSALKAVFLGVTVVTVGGLVYVLLQMNRNDVLSLITKTDPGRVTWSGPFVFHLALYILVPLAALLSTEFPFMREFLFSWVNPLLRALGKA